MTQDSLLLAGLREINGLFSQSMVGKPLPHVFDLVLEAVITMVDVDHATITLLDETSQQFFRIEAEHPSQSPTLVGKRIRIGDRPTQLKLVDSQKPVVANDLGSHPLFLESASVQVIAKTLDIRSVLIVAMVAEGRTIGTIGVDCIGRNKVFSETEVELCQTIANQVAAAIAIITLRHEQQKYRRQAELLEPTPVRPSMLVRTEEAANRLFRELAKVIEFKKAAIQLIVDRKRILVGAHNFPKERPHPWHLRPIDADPLIKDIVDRQRLKIIEDTSTAVNWEKQAGTSDVNSWIGIPLLLGGDSVGIVTLDHDHAGFYAEVSEGLREQLEDLAAHAAIDIKDQFRLECAQRQVQAMGVISRVAEMVTTKLDTSELLQSITKEIAEGLGCQQCHIFFHERNAERQVLICRAAYNDSPSSIADIPLSLPSPPGVQLSPIQHAFHTGYTVPRDNAVQTPGFNTQSGLYRNIRALIVVPLKIAGRPMGVLTAMHEQHGWLGQGDELLLQTLSRQLGVAIERDTGLELVHAIGKEILKATNEDEVLEEIVSGAIKLTHTDSSIIYLLNKDQSEVIKHFKTLGSEHPEPRLHDPLGITRTVIALKQMVLIPDTRNDPRVNPELLRRYRSMFAVPLLLDDSVVGVLYLNGEEARDLTDSERSLLLTLADQAALAIQRAQLIQGISESERLYRSLLNDIPQCVFRKDRSLRFTYGNTAFIRSLNNDLPEVMTMHDIVGKSDFDFYQQAEAVKYRGDDECVIATATPYKDNEKHHVKGAMSPIWVHVIKTPVKDSLGQVTGVQA